MPLLAWILIFSLVGGALGVVVSASVLLLGTPARTRLLPHLVSFATGALLGAAFLALLPHALADPSVTDPHRITATVLLGLLAFFMLEKFVLWRHYHHETGVPEAGAAEPAGHGPDPADASGPLILLGDALHNFVDGVLIAAAFLTSVELGVVTALAVAAHEVPQEVGDFAILLHSGYRRSRAFAFNLLSSLTTVLGAVGAYYGLGETQGAVPYVLAVAAASFIYVAVADLIPGLHRRTAPWTTLQQFLLIGAGIGVIAAAHAAMH